MLITNTTKQALTALAVTTLLACAVGTASAGRLSTSNSNIRVTWGILEFGGAGAIIRCPVTIEGSFHTRTIVKVARSLVGSITNARVRQESCTEGTAAAFNGVETYNGAAAPQTLPWHLSYESFVGRLPNITSITFLLTRIRFGYIFLPFCIGQYGIATDRISLTATREVGGGITSIRPIPGRDIVSLFRTDFGFCPARTVLIGSGQVTLTGTATRISITLI
jgi:hypothetical protein